MSESEKIDMLLKEIQNMREEMKGMTEKMNDLEHHGSKMSGHINFVEGVFNTVKVPFFLLMQSVSFIIPHRIRIEYAKNQGALPAPPNYDNDF